MISFYKWYMTKFSEDKYPKEVHHLLRQATKIAFNAALLESANLCKEYDGKLSPAAIALKMLKDESE